MTVDRRLPPSCEGRIPAAAGVGLKPEHYLDVLSDRHDVRWFEVHPENYMGAGGPPHHFLHRVREKFPISMHGVGLSIGSSGRLDRAHLDRLSNLVEQYEPGLISEHLAWSSHEGVYFNDLLPLPYTAATLTVVADHVDELQQALDRRVLIENPSTYVTFKNSEMTEIEFLSSLAKATGCGLLLDVNNVFVSSANQASDAAAYIEAFPIRYIGEIHLAGHAEIADGGGGRLLVDAHDREVADAVWDLYRRLVERTGPLPTLIEWDNEIPEWNALAQQARRAQTVMKKQRIKYHAAQ